MKSRVRLFARLADWWWTYDMRHHLDFAASQATTGSFSRFLTACGLHILSALQVPPPGEVLTRLQGYQPRFDLSPIAPWLYDYLLAQQAPDAWFMTARTQGRVAHHTTFEELEGYHPTYRGCVFSALGIAFFDLQRPRGAPLAVLTAPDNKVQAFLDTVFWQTPVWRLVYDRTFHLEAVDMPPYVSGDIDAAAYFAKVNTRTGILYGPSGSGKTQLAIAALRHAPNARILLLSLKSGLEITQRTLRPLMDALGALKPTGLLIDDCPLDDVDATLELLDRLRPLRITTVITYMHNETSRFGFAGLRPNRVDAPQEVAAPSAAFRARLLGAHATPSLVAATEGLFSAYISQVRELRAEGLSEEVAVQAAREHARIALAPRRALQERRTRTADRVPAAGDSVPATDNPFDGLPLDLSDLED